MKTPVGFVPRVRTKPLRSDILGTITTRIGVDRHDYKVIPGLYCVGAPTPESPVLVTANYKLTFDSVRMELDNLNAWILVADTRGINVWCAAGKALFSTEEMIFSVRSSRLEEIVSHREIILPQLGATGVAAHKVMKGCGFKVVYGPIRAMDLPEFIKNGNTADESMRMVTFSLKERVVLIPVEIFLLGKVLAITILMTFVLSGFGPDFFSLSAAWDRGLAAFWATLLGIITGSAIVPLALNQLPWRMFWPKGALTGLVAGILCALTVSGTSGFLESTALILWTSAISSYLAMNFTGSTPYTSPSGVEAEMRQGIPLQVGAALLALIAWITAPFMG
ncbi:MAG: hypothetical protein JEY79_04395 [Pseudodesulfovibrio sp.]|nr:hypothetical protein [Pseudodesulfovibrio sp.]